ncbi:cysteine desulfurase family protein [Chitinivibrio alkaliphilus]|uniref:cysteine desulfurase n=1 Tax=Chitinivibrio alkaliphilus ACht1 TaxID=1313304 RepID=U7D3K0_9BACT|nr:cysteine desulfurase family protein [Chitinivibrio alkaliphilus]ERP31079.1 cysteine desulfurase NifS [Chitinivibrio alkaliphilus ACht1]
MTSSVIYLDSNATTPVKSAVLDEMLLVFQNCFGNPSALYSYGQEAAQRLAHARRRVAGSIGAEMDEIVFTSGGTESNTTALFGLLERFPHKKHIVTTAVEHSSVYEACCVLEKRGYEVTRLGTDSAGFISPEEFARALREDTLLASVLYAGNETGAIQPVGELARMAGKKGVFFHTDAVQAMGKIPLDVNDLSVDLLSLSGHKFGGPKGAGALFVRRGIPLTPLLYGGGQENKRRSGTENVPAMVGLGAACELAQENLGENHKKLQELKRFFCEALSSAISSVCFYSGQDERYLPNTVYAGFPGEDQESLAMGLDLQGVCVATGSACGSSRREASRVLKAMGVSGAELFSALRFSFDTGVTKKELQETVRVLADIIL